jgi:hypothetical protein
MKKTLIITTLALLVTAAWWLINGNDKPANAVSKNINVEVYKNASYISPAYKNSFATLKVTVVRVNGKERDIVWQQTYKPTELKDFPGVDKPMTQKISIPNVNDKKERLEIYYQVTYNSQGSILNLLNTAVIEKGQKTGKLLIEI